MNNLLRRTSWHFRRALTRLLLASFITLAACASSPIDHTDAAADAIGDTTFDATQCPASNEAAGTRCYMEAECRYGYASPACGGSTLTCTLNRWVESRTDPTTACFSDGGTPGEFPCGDSVCAGDQFCIHPCSGVDAGPDSGVAAPPPFCGAPTQCVIDRGHVESNGRDWVCEGCS